MRSRFDTTRLLLAMAGSLAIHALVMSSARIELAAPPQPRPPLEARLAPAPAAPAAPKAAPKRRPETRQAAAKPLTLPAPVAPSSTPLFVPPEWDLDLVPEPDEAPVAAAEPPSAERLALAPQSAPEVPVNPLPRNGQIEYNVLYGSGDGLPVGRVVQSWKIENDQYLLTSDAETTGLVDFFRPQQLRYISQGRVTAKGLKPEAFFITRTRRGKTEAARAKFDWEQRQIHYGYPHDRKVAGLVEGAQDLMSLAYHFALAPPQPGRYRIAVTSGKDFEVHEIEVFPEEIIETPIGQLRTLPLKQIARPGKEHFDLWLAVQYNYLPVRLRHYDRKGEYSGEQVAVEIRVGDDVELARQ
ncbi:MAG TPA: DUF3108 domain-containing protein [Burkholderiales bacterium]|jgi:hypothetical protein|nr:DUF3108 domain-containing protein [Burkholderiales bacterium]